MIVEIDRVDRRIVEPDGLDHDDAGTSANISRSSVFLNLPTLVFGISVMNSKRSGNHHFANLRREKLAQLVGRRGCAFAQHDRGERPLVPLRVGHGDDGRLGDRGMRHQRVLELDRRDPLAAGLDHVLRAILDLDVAARVDRHDVAGLEPAVVGPALRLLGRVVVRRGDPRAAHLELAHRLAVPRQHVAVVVALRSSTSGSGMPCIAM